MPAISASIALQLVHELRARPARGASGASGCSAAKPGSRAMSSLILGLYFIVHEPSG